MGYAKNWLTKSEYFQLLDQNMIWRDELLIRTTYSGALRISETLNLKYPYDFDESDKHTYLVIRESKNSDEFEKQPIKRRVFQQLKRFKEHNKHEVDSSFVFHTRQSDQMTRQRAYQLIDKHRKDADISKKLGTHTLRRSKAMHMLDDGVDVSEVCNFLRHKNVKTTLNYLNISKKRLAELNEEVDIA